MMNFVLKMMNFTVRHDARCKRRARGLVQFFTVFHCFFTVFHRFPLSSTGFHYLFIVSHCFSQFLTVLSSFSSVFNCIVHCFSIEQV